MIAHYSRYFPQTRRSSGQREHLSPGFELLERGGFVRSVGGSGIHALLPLGWRVHEKITAIINDEMARAGVLNVQLPVLQPRELWEQTGRWKNYVASSTLFRTRDEHRNTEFALGPTAEEVVTALVAGDVRSWRELPLRLHQIGPKFRSEIRPRLGLLRSREFYMSDAYSFDRDAMGMQDSFQLFRQIYDAIFRRVGLEDVALVQADTGAITESGSTEFMALSDIGEDSLLICPSCSYGANAERADSRYSLPIEESELRPLMRVPTPGAKTMDQLQAQFPTLRAEQMLKTLIYRVDGRAEDSHLIAVAIRGDLSVNEAKLGNLIGRLIEPATEFDILEATGAPVGFAGPLELRGMAGLFFDKSTQGLRNFVCGTNEEDVHVLNVNFGRDIPVPDDYVEIHLAKDGDGCPNCDGILQERRGIELGHIVTLRQGYAAALGATYTSEAGDDEVIWMGWYRTGTTRLMQAIAEQSHDQEGLIWSAPIAPFPVAIVVTRPTDPDHQSVLAQLADGFGSAGIDVLVDDREASPGIKFKDADLIGCPVRITIGRGVANGDIELRNRKSLETVTVPISEAVTIATRVLGENVLSD